MLRCIGCDNLNWQVICMFIMQNISIPRFKFFPGITVLHGNELLIRLPTVLLAARLCIRSFPVCPCRRSRIGCFSLGAAV